MTLPDLARLGRHVAERQDAALEAGEAGEAASDTTRRYLAEYASRERGERRAGGRADGERVNGERAARRARTGVRLGLAALLVAIAGLALKEIVFAGPPLSFSVGVPRHSSAPALSATPQHSGTLRDWVSAPSDALLPIRFSDGTQIELEPMARARVVAVSREGAEVVIESGRAHVDVVPSSFRMPGETPWRISLGPFSVEVKGTRFDVEWDPRADEFSLDLFEGSVRVSGCQEGHSHTLVAGQGVRASCSEQRWVLVSASQARRSDAAPPPELAAAPTPAPSRARPAELSAAAESEAAAIERSEPGDRRLRSPPLRSRSTAPRSWQALALAGHYSAAFERALEAGFEAECERAAAEDLALLGDTARLNGDAARARAAYLALRRRFDGSPAAAQAAFALGRLAVNTDRSGAIEWFERSLREAPEGPLAAAAHDWLFELAGESGNPTRRRDAARSYLQQHPDGAHAEDARRILDEPR